MAKPKTRTETQPCPLCGGRKTVSFGVQDVPCGNCDATGKVKVRVPVVDDGAEEQDS